MKLAKLFVLIFLIPVLFSTCDEYNFPKPVYDDFIIGSWGPGHYDDLSMINAEFASITFYPNNYYILWESDCYGVEIGTYSYNPKSKKLSVSTILDENEVCGFADEGKDRKWAIEFNAEGNVATFILKSENAEVELKKVEHETSPLVGSWGFGHFDDMSIINAEFANMTFYPNNYYIIWESDCYNVEYGTYSYDPETKKITASNVVDNNEVCGLTDNGQDRNIFIDFSDDGNTLTFLIESEGAEAVLERVRKY